MKNVIIEKNEFGNTHIETRDSSGAVIGNECKGYMLSGIVLAGYDASSKVNNVLIRGNSYTNLIWKIYGPADPFHPERTNPGFKAEPEIIYAKSKPLVNRQLFGDEIVQYPDGSRFKSTRQGYLSGKTGTLSGKEGSTVVDCDNSTGLRVGMYLVVTGAGRGGAHLYTFIRSIDNNRLVLTEPVAKKREVEEKYSIMQPQLVASGS